MSTDTLPHYFCLTPPLRLPLIEIFLHPTLFPTSWPTRNPHTFPLTLLVSLVNITPRITTSLCLLRSARADLSSSISAVRFIPNVVFVPSQPPPKRNAGVTTRSTSQHPSNTTIVRSNHRLTIRTLRWNVRQTHGQMGSNIWNDLSFFFP